MRLTGKLCKRDDLFMMRKLLYNFQQWMQGRYGYDELSRFLALLSIVFLVLSFIRPLWFMYFLALACLGWVVFRCYSKNITKRIIERENFLKITEKPRKFFSLQKMKWKDRKIYKYFKCSSCGANLRVPKGKGKIEITCPKCHKSEIKQS